MKIISLAVSCAFEIIRSRAESQSLQGGKFDRSTAGQLSKIPLISNDLRAKLAALGASILLGFL